MTKQISLFAALILAIALAVTYAPVIDRLEGSAYAAESDTKEILDLKIAQKEGEVKAALAGYQLRLQNDADFKAAQAAQEKFQQKLQADPEYKKIEAAQAELTKLQTERNQRFPAVPEKK